MDDEYEHMTMHDSSVLCACCGDEKSDEQRKTKKDRKTKKHWSFHSAESCVVCCDDAITLKF